jgi:hypothetical protein
VCSSSSKLLSSCQYTRAALDTQPAAPPHALTSCYALYCYTCRLFPGLLQHVACAHIATAVTQERVSAAETALSLLTAGPTTCEALLLKSLAHVLLGDFKAASAAVKASAR